MNSFRSGCALSVYLSGAKVNKTNAMVSLSSVVIVPIGSKYGSALRTYVVRIPVPAPSGGTGCNLMFRIKRDNNTTDNLVKMLLLLYSTQLRVSTYIGPSTEFEPNETSNSRKPGRCCGVTYLSDYAEIIRSM